MNSCDLDYGSKRLTRKDILNSIGKKKNLEKQAALAKEDYDYFLWKK